MKLTWNSSSVTPNPLPSKVMEINANVSVCKAAILYRCTIDWLTCHYHTQTYIFSSPGLWENGLLFGFVVKLVIFMF